MNWGRLGKVQSSVGVTVQYWLADEDRIFGSDLAKREIGCGDVDSVMDIALKYLLVEVAILGRAAPLGYTRWRVGIMEWMWGQCGLLS